jgi:hypothetical protein
MYIIYIHIFMCILKRYNTYIYNIYTYSCAYTYTTGAYCGALLAGCAEAYAARMLTYADVC